MRDFLEWCTPWMGGSAGTAFELGRADLGWVFAVLAVAALIGRVVLERARRAG